MNAVVEMLGVTRKFDKKTALADLSLSVPQGVVFGLIGGNGAGKTTLIRHLLGLLRAQAGSVRVFGADPVSSPVEVLGRIGYLSENRDLPDWMRVAELMRYTRAFFPKWDAAYAEELRKDFDLAPDARIKTLSRGQRARAGLLVAVAHRPDLLILDEPSSGLDPVVRRDILGAIIRATADEGRTVLFSSHLLDEVERVADRIAMIHEGRIVLTAPLDEIKETHRRVTLRFGQAAERAPTLEGATACCGQGAEWTYVCSGDMGQVQRKAQAIGASIVGDAIPSLDEIFVSRVPCRRDIQDAEHDSK